MTQYRRGADFERQLKRYLEGLGYFVIRSAGSKGPVDLVAFDTLYPAERGDKPFFIQCKLSGRISEKNMQYFTEIAEQCGAQAVIATPQNFKEIWRD